MLPRDTMVFLKKRTFLPVTALLAMLTISACGGSTATSTTVNQVPEVHTKQTAVATANPCLGSTATAQATSTESAAGTPGAEGTTQSSGTPGASGTTTEVTPGATTEATPGATEQSTPSGTAKACATMPANSTTGASSTSAEGTVVKTASMMLNGKETTILTDGRGMTLYYSKEDTAQKSACTGNCTASWQPLLASEHGTANKPAHLSGSLTVVKTEHGNQLAYNGHLLYTYAKDTAPGQAHGENVDNKWLVATADMPVQH